MTANSIEEPVDARVRRRLRELRTERGLTLGQVAERASLDLSTLSRLEAGKRRLALDHIPALAAALGVSADQLLGSAPPQDPRVRGKPRRHDGMTMWPLSHHGSAGGLHAYKITVSAKRLAPPDPLPVHEGHDWLYVLDGRLRLCSARRTSRSSRRGRRVHHLDPALVRRRRRPRWSSSGSSGRTGRRHTCAADAGCCTMAP
jgi:transcriptional regulator with XRE-family HTH domain